METYYGCYSFYWQLPTPKRQISYSGCNRKIRPPQWSKLSKYHESLQFTKHIPVCRITYELDLGLGLGNIEGI